MTKPREPLTIDIALARIAGKLPGGWARMAELVDRKERTVRNWGDPDTPEQIPLDCAIRLDLAYRAAGGEDEPLHAAYTEQLRLDRARFFAGEIELTRHAATVAKESGDALQALITASAPGATEKQRRIAIREIAESMDAQRVTLSALITTVDDEQGSESGSGVPSTNTG